MENKPYVFISYAHMDSDVVLPCVNAMKQSGISLWYDEGIEAGSEWPEFIAEKVVSCTKFVLFISRAYLNSQNCKRELNFAISRKKDILSIFLEDVELSPGMEMQLGTYQAIYRKRFQSASAFHDSLCGEFYFNECRQNKTAYTGPQEQPRTVGASSAPRPQAAPATALPVKNRIVAALLALFLGGLGVHKFYLKQPWLGILYLVFFWAYIPGIVSFIEGIIMLFTTDEQFEKKYKCKVQS